jgi:hypothetical protein
MTGNGKLPTLSLCFLVYKLHGSETHHQNSYRDLLGPCCGSRSVSVRFGPPDLDPLAKGRDPNPAKSKNSKKKLIPAVLVFLYDFLSSKNYVNVPSKIINK